jgi:hypothetical protein
MADGTRPAGPTEHMKDAAEIPAGWRPRALVNSEREAARVREADEADWAGRGFSRRGPEPELEAEAG